MLLMSRSNWKSLVLAATLSVLTALSVAPCAEAALPLETLIRSSAGRVIFTELSTGSSAVSRVFGESVEASARQSRLIETFSDPRMTAVADEFSTRLNRIEARFREKFPNSKVLFEDASRSMNAAERACILRIAGEEFDSGFVQFLPSRPSGALKPYAASREAFLTEQVLRRTPETSLEKLNRWKTTNFSERTFNVQVFNAYEEIRRAVPALEQVLSPIAVHELLADSASLPLIRKLERIFIAESSGTIRNDNFKSQLVASLRQSLEGKVPASSIETRMRSLLRDPSSLMALKRALGEMTLFETQMMVNGGNALAPTAESWLGKFISETGASTVVRRFETAPGSGQWSEERLVVAVDAATAEKWKNTFGNEHFFGQLHTPAQGTLLVTFEGKTASWNGGGNDFRMPTVGSLVPMLVLSSTEGGRASRYFTYGRDWNSFGRIRNPWNQAEYCVRGAYGSCTHWFGNIPIGDRLVTEYKFPGWVDHDPYTPVTERGLHDPAPRIDTLNPYQLAESDEALREILRYPGHEQLSDVMGLTRQQLGAELANPGWVAYSVLGNTSADRLPVVFTFVQDARAPLQANFDLMINAH